ncbi:hypothetical protein HDK77DRAFT_425375 [Phyllosticta capitalensis]
MASSHDTPLIDRVYAAASHLHHLNKPVPHFLMDVHDAMVPHIENLQTTLEDRGWAPVSLPPFLSTLQARLAITGLVIAFGIFLVVAALPRGGGRKNEDSKVKNEEEVELKVRVVEEVVGEAGTEKQEIRSEVEVVKVEEKQTIGLETEPVPASSKTVSIAAEIQNPAGPAATPASPPSEPTTATPASPLPAPVSKKETKNSVDPRSPRPEPTTTGSSYGYRTSPIRTRSSTSSIPVRVPTTPARASSYPVALNTAVNKNASTPARKTTSPTTSPASAKVLAASYAWVMSEGLEWDDGGSGSETEEHSYNSGSHSDDDENDNSSPRSRKSLEDELSAAGYAGGELDNESSASEDENENDNEHDHAEEATATAVETTGALHPRRHSHTSDIEARYEEWRKTRASQHHAQSNTQQKSMTAPVGGLIGGGGVRKTRSHHSRKDSVLESANNNNSPTTTTGRSSLSMTKSVSSATRHALRHKRSSALKPWARKRKEDFGEWLKKKTNATT